MIGCKKGCLCNDINKELCCYECENFSSCKDYCPDVNMYRDDIFDTCENAYDVSK